MWKLLVFFSCMITDVGSDVVGNPTSITGYREKTLDIRCPYESGYETHVKYFCKGECNLDRNIIIESGSPAKDERFSLTDDTTARVFTVSITDLRTEDEGKYWCAVRRSLQTDVYSEIMLLVKTDNMITEVSTITPFSKNTPSYFSISSLNPQSSKTPHTDQSPSSTGHVIYICVGLVLVVIGFLIALMVLCKQKKQGKKSPRMTQSGSSDNVPTVLLPLDTREDITDESLHIYNNDDSEYQTIGEPSHKNMHSTITIYSTVERPDSMIYSTAEPQANQTIYTVAERPDSTIYTVAERPDSTIYTVAERPDPMIYSTAEPQADPMIYTVAEGPDPMIYTVAEGPDPMIYTVAEGPDPMIYSTAEKSFPSELAEASLSCSAVHVVDATGKHHTKLSYKEGLNLHITEKNEHHLDFRSADDSCAAVFTDISEKKANTEVNQNVKDKKKCKESRLPSSSSSSSSSSTSSSSSIKHPPITQNSQTSTSNTTTTSTFILKNSSLIIILSVVLVLIFIGLLLLIVTLYKRHKGQDSDAVSKMSHPEPGENEEVPQTSFYEEIKDIRRHNDSDTGRSTDCNSAQILKNPIYATPEYPTNPSDSTRTVYFTVQHPIGQLESSECESQQISKNVSSDCPNDATLTFSHSEQE
ncbi:uncharacterized protein LOC127644064 [Xyrauchen texanus]|uniref:uncharacterized protein LOC127644064 n=1 Tax=Xyrauchen texanus TaxID=154827 RepID=UPI002242AD50|nr:uncharacterized protein LOC127644064 [Xyrauchen texanus]